MNNLKPNRFYKMVRENYDMAMFEALFTEHPTHQLNLLNAIYNNCQPFYKPVEKSVRIFSFNENILGLKKSVKQNLLPGLIECDLKSAQLAIAATLWNIPEIKEFLSEKKSIWDELADCYGLKLNPDLKSILKNCLYATMYGMLPVNLKSMLNQHLGTFDPFFNNNIIKLLLKERNKQFNQISDCGGATSCFGNFLSTSKFSRRSILAQLAQAIELKLLYPIIKLARENTDCNGFSILLFQHDGFSWLPHRTSCKRKWSYILNNVVYESARSLGINTSLEVTYDPYNRN